ncbi:hypothetical protein HI914_07196 [Erysiphe necator]|nr:hypothetical protein HI914_07196 [Erysiphe necator]
MTSQETRIEVQIKPNCTIEIGLQRVDSQTYDIRCSTVKELRQLCVALGLKKRNEWENNGAVNIRPRHPPVFPINKN